MKIFRSVSERQVVSIEYDARWGTVEAGLVTSWLRGQEMACEKPNLSEEAMSGRLVVLPWKGGVEKAIKTTKVGVFNYLAMWQGLRREDLNIEPDCDLLVTCAGTGVTVVFTSDYAKYSQV